MKTLRSTNHSGPPSGVRAASRFRQPAPWSLLAFGVLVYAILGFSFSIEPVPAPVFLCAIALGALCLVPLFLWYHEGCTRIPAFEMICLCFALAYSLPIFILPHEITVLSVNVALPWEAIFKAELLTLGGVALLIVVFLWARRSSLWSFVPQLDLPLIGPSLSAYFTWAVVVGGAAYLGRSVVAEGGSYGALLDVLSSQLDIALVLLAYEAFERGRSKPLLYLLLAFNTLTGLASGMLGNALQPLAILFAVRWQVSRRFPVLLSLFLGVAFFVAQAGKEEFRSRAWYGADAGRNPLARLQVWWQSSRDVLAGKETGDTTHVDNVLELGMSRFDLLHKFALVILKTPSEVPFFEGETYRYMLYTWIPRVVWPEKPLSTQSTDMVDFAYGFRTPELTGVKVSIGMIAEAYANFGGKAVFVFMVIQGLIFGLMDRSLNGPNSQAGRAIYMTIMVVFLNGIGTNAVILFGSVLQFIVVNALILGWFVTRSTSRAKATPDSRTARKNSRRLGKVA